MAKTLISSYKSVIDKNDKDIELTSFLEGVKEGKWQDLVLQVRTIEDKKRRSEQKQKCPLVTISGSFAERKDAALRKHSGFIAIDVDQIDNISSIKKILQKDGYVYSAFISISGNGLCILFKIDGDKHLESFEGIAAYLYDNYQLIVDQSGKNVSRARFISYDPHLFLNEDSAIFKKYLPKKKPQKIQKVVFVKSDFEAIIKQFHDRGINICEDYSDWIKIAYSLISEFRESGLDYFHTLSSLSAKYSYDATTKQYEACLRNADSNTSKKVTIATIYYLAKLNGIEYYSEKTKEIIRAASSQHKSGIKPEQITQTLHEYAQILPEESKPIIDQVIKDNIKHYSDNIIDDVVQFLKPYHIKKNTITRAVEIKSKPIDDSDINSLFLDAKTAFDKVNKDLVCSILFSNRISSYNPIHDFFNSRDIVKGDCKNLMKLLYSVKSDTANYDKWITKWLVSVVASAYGKHSPLVLVFCGELQGTGKTHWFRHLLPYQLSNLFAESKMDAGKDDEILMTKKWIILDDEYGGKSKREEKRLKEITSKAWINIREPYGRVSVDLRRLSVFCGTSNESQILNDPTGNRRILPIHINSIDHELYNQCDKEMLWTELYSLYKSGYDYRILNDEINELNSNTEDFKHASAEEELISLKLNKGTQSFGEWLTITEIIQFLISDTKFNTLNNTRIGIILSKQGFEKKRMKKGSGVVTVFFANKQGNNGENAPF
jgi:predicted P-loop ATPase